MKHSLFEHKDYKVYLKYRIQESSKTQRGHQKKLADFLGSHSSYISQVLHGKPHLSLEQACKVNEFYGHDKMESRFFILLLEISKAGTKELKKFFLEQLDEIKQQRFDLKKRLKNTKNVPLAAQHKYYSTWYYAAVHMALAIPKLQEAGAIARRLHLPEKLVIEAIRFLEDCRLVVRTENGYEFTDTKMHLSRDSDFIQRHHINWRSQSLQSVEKNLPEDLHYSLIFAISKEDKDRIRDILIEAIENSRKIVAPSPSEEIVALTIDLFDI